MENYIFLDVLASLQRLFVSYIPAVVLGSFIGYLISINGRIYQIFRRIFQIPHSIPPIALLPIALIVFKESEAAAVIVIFMGTVWTIVVNTAIGMRHFRRQNNNFRAAIFHIFHSLKVGVWVAWFTVIATEMLMGPKGLGFLVWDSYKSGNTNYIIEAILYIGIIGFLLDQLLDFIAYILSQMVSDGRKSS
ncbi:ABC transporter permease [Cylindrospermum sp. FACHB-282]|uniref:ABC transporter permease n=1 Tax=Cylindrospermum sp. FACHB-282 TaxID=2692794 RepID=UPI001685783F|nr:ABC transporter permease subunit [Cylindrospermum sp. FACHB-282]MBD2388695.1 nitrate transporter [Cylindrospermum sp. FACHB-282]